MQKWSIFQSQGPQCKFPGHKGCTATLKYSDNVGDEQQGGRKLAKLVTESRESICIGKVTTYVDERMVCGIGEEMKTQTGMKTQPFLDTVHFNRSVAAAISRSKN